MIRLLNKNKEYTALIENSKDLVINKRLKKGQETLSFSLYKGDKTTELITEESYIETKENRYIIKGINNQKTVIRYTAALDIETLESVVFADGFKSVSSTVADTIRLSLAGSGWTVEVGAPLTATKRSLTLDATSAYEVILKACSKWDIEAKFKTLEKKVYITDRLGQNKGAYFTDELNLTTFNVETDSYDLVTRLVVRGKDGLSFASVNGGKDYVENFAYTNKVKTKLWVDSRYTDAAQMLADAKRKLEDLSKPKVIYDVEMIDLSKLDSRYSFLSYDIGDTITVISRDKKIKDTQRIMEMRVYPLEPERNSATIANTHLTFEDLQKKNEEMSEKVENAFNEDGTINGNKVDGLPDGEYEIKENSIEAKHIKADSIETRHLQADSVTANKIKAGEISAGHIKAGTITANSAIIDDAAIGTAKIANASITTAKIADAAIDSAKIDKAQINSAHIQDAAIGTAQIDDAAITNAKIGSLAVDTAKIKDASITNAKIANLSADKITAGDISADRITTGVITAINANIGTATINSAKIGDLSADKITTGTLNADRIGAGSIDAGKITAGAITTDKLAANSVTTEKIKAGSIVAGSIAAGAVETDKLKAGAVTADKIGANAITTDKLAANSVTAEKIKAGSIDAGKITADAINTISLGASQITANQIASGEIKVGDANIVDGTISGAKITKATISNAEISEAFIADAFVKNIVADKIKGGTLDAKEITVRNLNAESITVGKINGVQIAQGTISAGNLDDLLNNRITTTEDEVKDALEGMGIAQTTATAAQNAANAAKTEATTAKNDANAAKTLANTANTNATTAVSTANTANTNSSNAVKTANTANTNATNATNTANTANTNATNAVNTSNTANTNATNAVNSAKAANDKVDGLEIGGTNLLIQKNITRGKYLNNTGAVVDNGSWFYTDYIKVQNFVNVSISGFTNLGSSPSTCFYDANKSFISGINNNGSANNCALMKVPTNAVYMRSSGEIKNLPTLKIEKGNKPTSWSPAPEDVQEEIGAAITSADGKNKVFYQTSAPATSLGLKVNDTWFDTDDGNRIYRWDGSAWVTTQLGSNAIANAAITSAQIKDATITSAKISALDAGKITTGTLLADRIGALSITTAKLQAGAITADKLAANAVTAGKIAANAIKAGNIEAGAITTDKLAAGSINSSKLDTDELFVGENAFINSLKAVEINAANITTGKISSERLDITGLVGFEAFDDTLQPMFNVQGDKTYINGGMIATNTIKADKIDLLSGLTVQGPDNSTTFAIGSDGNVEVNGLLQSGNFDESKNTGYRISPDGTAILNQARVSGEFVMPNAGITNYGATIGNENIQDKKNLSLAVQTIHQNDGYTVEYTTNQVNQGLKVATNFEYMADEVYTLSYDIQKVSGEVVNIGGHSRHIPLVFSINGNPVDYNYHNGFACNPKDGETFRVVYTFKANSTTGTDRQVGIEVNRYTADTPKTARVKITNIKVEKGDKATPWCPHKDEQFDYTRMWAGSSYEARDNAPFRVTQKGDVWATNATLSGRLVGDYDNGKIHIHNNEIVINDKSTMMLPEGQIADFESLDASPNAHIILGTGQSQLNTDVVFGTNSDKRIEYSNSNRTMELNKTELRVNSSLSDVTLSKDSYGIGISNKNTDAWHTIQNSTSAGYENALLMYARGSAPAELGGDFRFAAVSRPVRVRVQGDLEVDNTIKSKTNKVEQRAASDGWGWYSL